MLRLILVSVLFVASYALEAKRPLFLCRETSPVDSFKLNDVAETGGLQKMKGAASDLTESLAQQALAGLSVSDSLPINFTLLDAPQANLRQAKLSLSAPASSNDGQSSLARTALKSATGSIIAHPTFRRCPRLSNSYSPQPLCPYTKDLLRTFYSRGRCYVLFPNWQRKYYTRCLCRECRTECISSTRRNLCTPERYSYTNVWAICRSGWSWRIKNVRVRLAQGKCECKSYRKKCFRG